MRKQKILKTFPANVPYSGWESRIYADGVRDCLAEVRPGPESSVQVFKTFSSETGTLHNVEIILYDEPDQTPPRTVEEVTQDLLDEWNPEHSQPMGYDFFKFMDELKESKEYYKY